jgi:LysM repeat protein
MSKNPLSFLHTRQRRCPACGAQVAQSARTCLMCGADLPPAARRKRQAAATSVAVGAAAEWTCPACGAPVARRAKKCLMCGAALVEWRPAGGEEVAAEAEAGVAHGPAAERGRCCPACGAPVAGTAAVCLMCGADLMEEPAAGAARPVVLPLWQRVLRVAWAVIKLPLAAVLAGGILLGIGVLLVNQPWKPAAVIDSPLVTPMDTPTEATPTNVAAPTDTLTFTPSPTATDTPTSTATATSTPTPLPVITYTVRLGDSWISIANQFRVEAVDLAQFNGRSVNDVLLFGEVIQIPPAGAGAMPVLRTHVVQRGDSLERIAQRYNVSIGALRIANALPEDYVLKVGEALTIPWDTPTPPTPTPTPTGTPTATPTATATPWPDTPTPLAGYLAPALLAPPDGQVIEGGDAVLLTWASVGVLADDEWYVLRLGVPGDVAQPEAVWVKTTGWRAPADLRPAQDVAEEPFEWQVVVVRLVETLPDGSRRTEPQSPLSETRTFYWR